MMLNDDGEMSLIEHLTELRVRLIISIVALAVCTVGAFFIARPVLNIITLPVQSTPLKPRQTEQLLHITIGPDGRATIPRPPADIESYENFVLVWPADEAQGLPGHSVVIGPERGQQLFSTSPLDPFMMQLKVALIVGILIALPIILFQGWCFIRPGLTPKERRVVKPLMAGALILFPLGSLFAFFMIRLILLVMQGYVVEGIDPLIEINKYISLIITMMLVFGIIFELPLVIAIAARIGLVTPRLLSEYRRHVYVGLAFASMVLTPADPFSMIAAFIPMVILFELAVILARPMAAMHALDLKSEQQDDQDMS